MSGSSSSAVASSPSPRVFILPPGYTGLRIIGTGAYGCVVSAKDPSGGLVAVKRIPKWTSDVIDGKRILREVKLLRFLSGHENILKVSDNLLPPLIHHSTSNFSLFSHFSSFLLLKPMTM